MLLLPTLKLVPSLSFVIWLKVSDFKGMLTVPSVISDEALNEYNHETLSFVNKTSRCDFEQTKSWIIFREGLNDGSIEGVN